jgi:hypothetical protein
VPSIGRPDAGSAGPLALSILCRCARNDHDVSLARIRKGSAPMGNVSESGNLYRRGV